MTTRIWSPYGKCPKCGAWGVMRERRPNGNDECENGCKYPSRDAIPQEKGE
jgi:predicted ATP-dependent serine protease